MWQLHHLMLTINLHGGGIFRSEMCVVVVQVNRKHLLFLFVSSVIV